MLSDWKTNTEKMVIDFTRYDIKVTEPESGSIRNWSLLGEVNQKQTRPQDKPIPLTKLPNEMKSTIKIYYQKEINFSDK